MNGKSESETPEVDAVVHNGFNLARVARSLERRLAAALLDVEGHKAGEGCQHQRAEESERREALAQTEIKGHMRIEDDLKRDLGLERESHEVTKRMLGDRDGRIAALERVLRDLLAANPRYDASAELDAAIDAALKVRA